MRRLFLVLLVALALGAAGAARLGPGAEVAAAPSSAGATIPAAQESPAPARPMPFSDWDGEAAQPVWHQDLGIGR